MEIRKATIDDLALVFAVEAECFPACRKKGYAGLVLRRAIHDAEKEGRRGLVLTCKKELIHYYGKFGFLNEGISVSVHGNVVWYQMRLTF